jgi:hypothetical protein
MPRNVVPQRAMCGIEHSIHVYRINVVCNLQLHSLVRTRVYLFWDSYRLGADEDPFVRADA